MDDRELIKRIMEEVKDEKLREELLALVVEKNKKREEERPIDYLARQEILGGATEGVSKVGWWIMYIISIVFILVGSLGPLGLLGYFLTPAEERDRNAWVFIFFFSILFMIGIAWFFTLRSGKKEYERFKHKSVN
ncbi:hypothetical protein THERU_05120 [Thermocrinis ruber]|uniref:Uncharacterized protein n=2 Tax=Thermocrinis ruber TaxID=75906 RepID=W0DE05_9AQUI|nr:hypothetical protein THERU_05120 [Thermocrinis ruber]